MTMTERTGLVRLLARKVGQVFCDHEDRLLKIPPARSINGTITRPGELRVRCSLCGRESEGFQIGEAVVALLLIGPALYLTAVLVLGGFA